MVSRPHACVGVFALTEYMVEKAFARGVDAGADYSKKNTRHEG